MFETVRGRIKKLKQLYPIQNRSEKKQSDLAKLFNEKKMII